MYTLELAALEWLHVIAAIVWFGAILHFQLVLTPALKKAPAEVRAGFFAYTRGGRPSDMMTWAAVITVVTGIARGVRGHILDTLNSSYGLTWQISLAIVVSMIVWKLTMIDTAILQARSANAEETSAAALRRYDLIRYPYVAGFFVVFTLMIAMRFGY